MVLFVLRGSSAGREGGLIALGSESYELEGSLLDSTGTRRAPLARLRLAPTGHSDFYPAHKCSLQSAVSGRILAATRHGPTAT